MEKNRTTRRASATAPRNGRKRAAGSDSGAGTGDGTAIFNEWLETRLRNAYSSVLEEPVPEDLIRLINDKLKK